MPQCCIDGNYSGTEAMTTNQTIDGVPRELIQWLVDHEDLLDFGGRESDLRALLEAKPKAEPVAYLCKASGSKWLQYGAKVSDPWRPEEVELTPLYAEQPAPVAVALPAQRNSADGRNDERVEGYNQALADVRRAISFSAKNL
jgi:hypothetical protein